jgi:hypothetical protein
VAATGTRTNRQNAYVTTQAHLTPLVVVIVIGAGALHATWNAIAKQVDDRLMAFAWIGIASTVGGGFWLVLTGLPYRAAIGFAIASAIIHIGYDLALMNSYRLGAFNQTYPIARGTSPLVVAIGAYFLANEHLSAAALLGIGTLAVGLMALALSAGRLSRAEMPAVGAAVLTGLTIAAYTIVDGLGVRRAHDPWAYVALLFLLQGPAGERVAGYKHDGPRAARRCPLRCCLRHRLVGPDPRAASRGSGDPGDERRVRRADRGDAVRGGVRPSARGRCSHDRDRHRADQPLSRAW